MDFGSILTFTIEQAFGPLAIVYCLAAIGLNVHFGYTGLLNFGQAAFMAVGGYTMASFVAVFGLSLWLGLAVGVLMAVVLALLLGIPTLRLRADYLAIVTIAAAEIIRQTLGSVTFDRKFDFGGQDGLQSNFVADFRALNPLDGPISIGPISWRVNDAWVMIVGWALVAICCVVVWLLMRSPWGRVLKAIREDEDAVRSLGKNVYAYKMQALIVGGIFGAFAGFIYGFYKNAVIPTDYATDTTFYAFTVLLVGGAARVLGPVVGAVIVWGLLSGLGAFFTQAARNDVIPNWLMNDQQASLMRFIILGLALMLIMIFRPQGIFGDRKELAIDGR
ncbi:branched-chain amino acid ABC transporter permease [Nocardioides sp. GXZ039]|uniref:branched-chain amino acid ABC transporter permease n=1 Tax=Nocardioides sp. GXZ039 TaxID=3136018 RepID=UPI0030F47485